FHFRTGGREHWCCRAGADHAKSVLARAWDRGAGGSVAPGREPRTIRQDHGGGVAADRKRTHRDGRFVQGPCDLRPETRTASGIRVGMKIHAPSLSALDGIGHAFFTRAGGVSAGVYASLNSGIGSKDDAAHVAENRARMAGALGVEAARLITAFQIHSPK